MKTVRQMLLLSVSLGLAACTVNHHHHYPDAPPEGVSSTGQEDEYGWEEESYGGLEEEAPIEVAEEVVEADVRVDGPMEIAKPEARKPVHTQRSVLLDCELVNHDSGWVIAKCPDATVVLQTGPAARGPLSRIFSYAGDFATGNTTIPSSYSGKRGSISINGRKSETVEFVLRESRRSGFGGTIMDPNGAIVGEGIYTILQTENGKMGALCVQEGNYSRARCLAYFNELSSKSMKGVGVPPSDEIAVAGIRLKSEKECYFLRPAELGCSWGSLYWESGDAADLESKLNAQLAQWTDTHGVKGFHNPHLQTSCVIAGQATTCHEVRFQGVLDTPSQIYHIAQIGRGEDATLFSCSYSTSGSMPGPCRQVFESRRTAQNRSF